MPAGRPLTLTPEVRDLLCEAVREGNFRLVAAQFAGVNQRTFSEWMTRGRREPDGPYGELLRAIQAAESEAEMKALAVVMAAAVDDPANARWYLERKFPERWGSQSRDIRDLKKRLDELEKAAHGHTGRTAAKGAKAGAPAQG